MAVTVKIPAQLRAVTDGEGEVEVDGATVGEALDAVRGTFSVREIDPTLESFEAGDDRVAAFA